VAKHSWTLPRVLAIASGGAAGATARWAVLDAFPSTGPFPWSVLTVNIAGSLLLGALVAEEWRPPRLRLLLHDAGAIGFCGGLTTFSTYAVGVVHLVDSDHVATAITYTLTTVLATVIAVIVGAATLRRWRAAGRPVDEAR
jgi:CrcB protein